MEALSAVIIIGGWLFYQLLRDLLKVYLDTHYPVFSYDQIKNAEKDRDEKWKEKTRLTNLLDSYRDEHKKELNSVKNRKEWPEEYIRLQKEANDTDYWLKHRENIMLAMKEANFSVFNGIKSMHESYDEFEKLRFKYLSVSDDAEKEFNKWLNQKIK